MILEHAPGFDERRDLRHTGPVGAVRLRLIAIAAALSLAAPVPAGADATPRARRAGKPARAHRASARKLARHTRELTPGEISFWEWLIEPNAAELQIVLNKARENVAQATGSYALWDYTGTLKIENQNNRDRLLDDALGMLRYALKLQPDNVEVKREIGYAADERGDMELARQMLEQYLADEIAERVQPLARVRLGRLYARQEKWEEAIAQLRLALGDPQVVNDQPQAVVTLASVYMEQGRLAEAIDLLKYYVDANRNNYYSTQIMIPFALAVAYDRDEQITLAHDTLDKLVAGGQTQNLVNALVESTYTRLQFTPAIDRHYFAGLQYESMGYLSEAREEFAAYARAGEGARYRERARTHIRSIDQLQREQAAAARRKKKAPGPEVTAPVPPPTP